MKSRFYLAKAHSNQRPVLRWILVLVPCLVLAARGAEHPSFDAFRKHLGVAPTSFEIEFDDGDVRNPPHHETKLDKDGQLVFFKPSVSHFAATWQNDGFVIRRDPDLIPVRQLPKNTLRPEFRFAGGYSGDRAWSKTDNSGIRMFALTPELRQKPSSILALIRDYERRAWGAYLLGLPRLDSATIQWDGLNFQAVTWEGKRLTAECHLDPEDGALETLTYQAEGPGVLSASVAFEYDPDSPVYPLPSVFTRTIRQATTPLLAAQNTTSVRLRVLKPLTGAFAGAHFLPSEDEFKTNHLVLHSNEMVFAKSGAKFIPVPQELIKRTALLENEGGWKRRSLQIALLAVLLAPGLVWAALRRSHTHKTTKQRRDHV